MAQILPFTPRSLRGIPAATTALEAAESLYLLALRWWVVDVRAWADPAPRLCQAMAQAGAEAAAASVDQFMRVLARTAQRPVELHLPCCSCVAGDEQMLLHAARLAQCGEPRRAAACLTGELLPALAADFALGPLAGLGTLFGRAGLYFPHRAAPDAALRQLH
jgi:hypothetical protein